MFLSCSIRVSQSSTEFTLGVVGAEIEEVLVAPTPQVLATSSAIARASGGSRSGAAAMFARTATFRAPASRPKSRTVALKVEFCTAPAT